MNEIPTPRPILRPFRETDYDDLYEFLSQLRDDEFEGYPGIMYDNGRRHLDERVGSESYYAMELRSSGKVIGNIDCGRRDFEARELGYIVNKDDQRRGYALEALSAVMGQAFRSGAHRLYAQCDPRNTASWKLLEAAGLRREAHFRRNLYFRKDGTGAPVWKGTYVYAILEHEPIPVPLFPHDQQQETEVLRHEARD
ncbi:MAG: GNAT family N-acetyltransferase [Oscillospiraceae bacterium]|nr:GNAT family N-acetyltransferase [Oscillospiraceae bacterium]